MLEMAGLAGHKIEVLQSQGWDAYQKLVRLPRLACLVGGQGPRNAGILRAPAVCSCAEKYLPARCSPPSAALRAVPLPTCSCGRRRAPSRASAAGGGGRAAATLRSWRLWWWLQLPQTRRRRARQQGWMAAREGRQAQLQQQSQQAQEAQPAQGQGQMWRQARCSRRAARSGAVCCTRRPS